MKFFGNISLSRITSYNVCYTKLLRDDLKTTWQKSLAVQVNEVTQNDIYDLISKITGIPSVKFEQNEKTKLLQLEDYLKERVIGQDEAVKAITASVRRARAGISNPNRPLV